MKGKMQVNQPNIEQITVWYGPCLICSLLYTSPWRARAVMMGKMSPGGKSGTLPALLSSLMALSTECYR